MLCRAHRRSPAWMVCGKRQWSFSCWAIGMGQNRHPASPLPTRSIGKRRRGVPFSPSSRSLRLPSRNRLLSSRRFRGGQTVSFGTASPMQQAFNLRSLGHCTDRSWPALIRPSMPRRSWRKLSTHSHPIGISSLTARLNSLSRSLVALPRPCCVPVRWKTRFSPRDWNRRRFTDLHASSLVAVEQLSQSTAAS